MLSNLQLVLDIISIIFLVFSEYVNWEGKTKSYYKQDRTKVACRVLVSNIIWNIFHVFSLDPSYRRGRVYKLKFCLSVCLYVITSTFPFYGLQIIPESCQTPHIIYHWIWCMSGGVWWYQEHVWWCLVVSDACLVVSGGVNKKGRVY